MRKGWWKFVHAWEELLGDSSRPARRVPEREVLAMNEAYKVWRSTAPETSARDWLKANAASFERMGFFKVQPGEVKITSSWAIDVWAFDDEGHWSKAGHNFAAVRSFSFQDGYRGVTHAESCMHNHPSREEAFPCVRAIRALTGDDPPTLEDVEGMGRSEGVDPLHRDRLLFGRGRYADLAGENWPEGIVALARSGFVVPYHDGGMTVFPWGPAASRLLRASRTRG
jgi:hypothetical protein